MEFNSDLIVNGGAGLAVGTGIGWVLKKTINILFKMLMVLAVLFVGALVYLQSIKVININERAFDSLVQEGYNQLNQTMGHEAFVNPVYYIATNLGLPMSGGLMLGLAIGWSKAWLTVIFVT